MRYGAAWFDVLGCFLPCIFKSYQGVFVRYIGIQVKYYLKYYYIFSIIIQHI